MKNILYQKNAFKMSVAWLSTEIISKWYIPMVLSVSLHLTAQDLMDINVHSLAVYTKLKNIYFLTNVLCH